jgi:hypothetical protein
MIGHIYVKKLLALSVNANRCLKMREFYSATSVTSPTSATPVRAGLPKFSFIVDDICKPAPADSCLPHPLPP